MFFFFVFHQNIGLEFVFITFLTYICRVLYRDNVTKAGSKTHTKASKSYVFPSPPQSRSGDLVTLGLRSDDVSPYLMVARVQVPVRKLLLSLLFPVSACYKAQPGNLSY